ncbi:PREDICTED: uncharacterized protein LOC104820974 [Tarenaya hassleriana]|uniref:Uncharacterized protein n=1 Tax=Tarenaya spinosa TaxID=228870 RepID=Q1KUY3_9ROSI|nr:PREDICTED: uncharacterized protein LOC104820974 [Tarenaya hassleriana]ABD96853.1 hypothetical protein [Tarenaya spinosa]
MQNITGSEIAGFAVGALLLGATVAAPKVDAFIAASQRRSLGMCGKCGNLKVVACGSCKGTGSIKPGGPFGFNLISDASSDTNSAACNKCKAKGCFPCPECSKA